MLKTPLEMIAEWKKGCTCGGPVFDKIEDNPPGTTSPARCEECTAALVDALETVLQNPTEAMIEAGVTEFELGEGPPKIFAAMVAVPRESHGMPRHRLIHEPKS